MRKIDLKQFEGKKVNVTLKSNELLTGVLEKVRGLPLWKINDRKFLKWSIRKIYFARY